MILKDDEELTQGPDHWYQHFKKFLNVQNEPDVITAIPTMPAVLPLASPGGLSGILSELFLYGGPVLWDRLMEAMWRKVSDCLDYSICTL